MGEKVLRGQISTKGKINQDKSPTPFIGSRRVSNELTVKYDYLSAFMTIVIEDRLLDQGLAV